MAWLLILFLTICSTLIKAEVGPDTECPLEGLYSGAHEKDCDKYYLCTNGTLTLEECPNGLAYAVQGAVYNFCAFLRNVNCEGKEVPLPISTPGCPWQWGYFEEENAGPCSITYSDCAWGVPEQKYCEPFGLVYDDRIKGCNWPDEVGCNSEDIIGFKCPEQDTQNRYWPYPRYAYNAESLITCVHGQPRLIYCSKNTYVDENSLICVPYEKN